ncbi:MAG: Txe/YoeB family addiction module toxin [Selenomonadaceae bacterium]|nr:Txe/YoeB family addiction module toxin [Selenomonadaceae bacterium]
MNKLWTDAMWEHYLYWQKHDMKMLQKINQLIKDIERNGAATGIGKPERLKGRPVWSRRIDHEHRLTYDIQDNTLYLISCKGHYEE